MRIIYGAVLVRTELHERDAIYSVLARKTTPAKSSAYRWLTELKKAGILKTEPTRRPNARQCVRYHLPDEELCAAA